ncbi:MAG: class I SAM-dependent methyltransferase [Hyphomicrobium sp.]
MANIQCPICSGASWPAHVAAEHHFYRCQNCQTAFVYPVPDSDKLAKFYDAFHRASAEGGWYDEVEDRMQADFPAKIALLKSAFPNGGPTSIVDVGCGKGYFVRACAEVGLNAFGVDLSESGVRFAREELGVTAYAGLLAHLKPKLGTYSAATLWATIEHLPEPVQMLRDISDVLQPGGKLFLDTGIGHDWLDRMLPGRVQWYDPPQHLFVFSAKGLKIALELAGFRIERFDPNFERSRSRRYIKTVRNALVAAGLRATAEAGGMAPKEPTFVRFPLGNLMSATAVKIAQ